MELRLIKRSDGLLEAFDDESLDRINTLSVGEYMPMDYKQLRHPKNHRRWFHFRNVTFDQQDQYGDRETWRGVLQIMGGHCKHVVDARGNTHIWPESISYKVFDDEKGFKQMFRRAVAEFLRRYGHGMSETEFLRMLDFE